MINGLKFTFRLSSFYNFENLIFSYSFYFRKRDIPFSLTKKKEEEEETSVQSFKLCEIQLSKSIINSQKSGFIYTLALYNTVVTVVYCARSKKRKEVCGIMIDLTNVQKDGTPLMCLHPYLMN